MPVRLSRAVQPVRMAPVLSPDAELYDALVLGTRDYVRKNGFTDVVIGLSGGIDSTIVACVAVDALGAEHVHGVSMPSRYSSDGSKSDAYDLAERLGIEIRTIPIELDVPVQGSTATATNDHGAICAGAAIAVLPGDIVVMATDGLFDNVDLDEIVDIEQDFGFRIARAVAISTEQSEIIGVAAQVRTGLGHQAIPRVGVARG